METSTDRIKRLQREIDLERKAIDDCAHVFGDAVYDPETVKDPVTELQAHGSDVWPEIVGYHERSVPRWSKTCSKCGMKIYTKEQKAVAFVPDFGRQP